MLATRSASALRARLPCLLALWCLTCEGRPAEPPSEPLVLLVDGCSERLADGTCELSESRVLTLWMKTRDATPSVLADGHVLKPKIDVVHHGLRLQVTVPQESTVLDVQQRGRAARLTLASAPAQPTLTRAREALQAGKLEDAWSATMPLLTAGDARVRASALDLAARIEMQRGEIAAALTRFEAATSAATAAGLIRTAAKARLAMAFLYEYRLFEPQRALALLERVDPRLDLEVGWTHYHRAVIAYYRGDARAVLAHTDDALTRAEQLGHQGALLTVSELRLSQLADLGRIAEARALGERLRPMAAGEPCDRARLSVNLGWAELSAEGGDLAVAEQLSRDAVHAYDGACPDRPKRQNALVNLALAKWKQGEHADARRAFAEAVALGETDGVVQSWVLELNARLSLDEGHTERALHGYEELRERAQTSPTLWARFRAELGRGRALSMMGRLREAKDALEAAERELDEDARRVPLGEGRDAFASSRGESAQLLVDTLLRLGRPEEALLAARRARARALRMAALRGQLATMPSTRRAEMEWWLAAYRATRRSLLDDDRRAWTLARGELRAFHAAREAKERQARGALDRALSALGADTAWHPAARAPSELLLLYTPLEQGFAAFAQDDEGVRAERLTAPARDAPRQALSEALLAPFTREIGRAERVRIVASGALKEVDFHALPFGDGTLLEELPVVYGTDLGQNEAAAPSTRLVSLLVADPLGDLPSAREEALVVASALQAEGDVTLLMGAQAGHAPILAALALADVFHFAGHGEFRGSGWQSRLPLADEGAIEPGDILALSSVPRRIVLSGCETTRERSDVDVLAIGLGQAFIARGAELVVATTRPVPDALGLAMSRALAARGLPALDAGRFREAVLEVRAREDGRSDWASYRLLVP